MLLRYGADTTLRNYDGQSALEVASPVIKQIILDCVESSSVSVTQKLLQVAWVGNSDIVNQILVSFQLIQKVSNKACNGFHLNQLAIR